MNKFYLKEFQFFDGEHTVVFNIVALDDDKITVAVTHSGKRRGSHFSCQCSACQEHGKRRKGEGRSPFEN